MAKASEVRLLSGAGFAVALGNGVATQFDVLHNFNTRDLHVTVYRSSAPYDDVACSVERVSLDAVRLTFVQAPSVGQYRAVVFAR